MPDCLSGETDSSSVGAAINVETSLNVEVPPCEGGCIGSSPMSQPIHLGSRQAGLSHHSLTVAFVGSNPTSPTILVDTLTSGFLKL